VRINSVSDIEQHLTYCSNIHPAESWQDVYANLQTHLPPISKQLAGTDDFGIGLRLSAEATDTLAKPEKLEQFRDFLHANQYYVFTLNGFPYGTFHGTRVKQDVYLPDWKDVERLRYTEQLTDVLAALLPAGSSGSISTVPGAYKDNVTSDDDRQSIAHHLIRAVAKLVRTEREYGASINLALEPEPCCFLETIDESVEYFNHYLYSPAACKQLGGLLGESSGRAEQLLRKHLSLCYDICHAAVEFEDAGAGIDQLRAAGIKIGKLQISAGLRVPQVSHEMIDKLQPFAEGVYLHQVVEKVGNQLNRYSDLPLAIDNFNASQSDGRQREWRVHFHVPVFLDQLSDFSSTQFFIREILQQHKRDPISEHLEVETYTWDVLPAEYRDRNIDQAIVTELQWVSDQLAQ